MSKKVIQVTLGTATYIGEADEGEYYKKRHNRWLKLEKTCIVQFKPNPQGISVQFHKLSQDGNYLEDIEILLDVKESSLPLIIRTLNPEGELWRTYKNQWSPIEQPKSNRILPASCGFMGGRQN